MSKAEVVKAARVEALMRDSGYRFIYFKGADLMSGPGTRGFVPFDHRLFSRLVHDQNHGTTENMVADFAKTVKTLADDWTDKGHLIAFYDRVWDMKKLDFTHDLDFVYSTDIALQPPGSPGYEAASAFLLQLAENNTGLYNDYKQALAPLFMARKPSGVIWFVGNGANGKSALLNALYLLLGKYFSSVTTSQLEDGKIIPALAGVLGNIVRESSEMRVEDSGNYKSVGTHELLSVRKLYTQEAVTIPADFHTIFNANNVPTFGDKTQGVRRRTLIIPFNAHFSDDPTFEDKTFTPEFLGGLAMLLLEETRVVADNGYRYQWSPETVLAKIAYDSEVNSAEAFVKHLVDSHVLGFSNYAMLMNNYRDWCSREGLNDLHSTTLKRVIANTVGANKKSVRVDGKTYNRFFFDEAIETKDTLVWLDGSGYGMPTPPVETAAPVDIPKLSKDW